MSKATEAALAELHGEIAKTLILAVQPQDHETDNGRVIKVAPSAAHIMAGITFLKNNNITADATSNAALSDLQAALSKTRQDAKGRMSKNMLEEVAEKLDRELGGLMQ
jgi:hypothetical protein